MKSRTSFCKLATFKKDLTRFAPLWALYLIAMMLILTETVAYDSYDRIGKYVMAELNMAFGIVNLCYALICALTLFGDLYNTRMCYSLHTQPTRREGLFLSHLAAALCFSIVPNAVAAVYMMFRLEAYWFLALYWLLAATVQFVFFFGLAAVSALAVGNRVGMIAVYGVLNFFSMIAYWVVDTIYLPNLPGVVQNFDLYALLCPVVYLFSWTFFEFKPIETWVDLPYNGAGSTGYYETFYEYTGLGTGWGYLAILGGIGVAALVLALVLYRARHLESAGDFVAFRKLSPVVCVVLTVCVAVGFAFLGDAMSGGLLAWLAVGLLVGWYGSRMLIERRVKVFHRRNFLGLILLAAVLVASFLVVTSDTLNIVGFVPEADKVESVTITNYFPNQNGYNVPEYYYGSRIAVTLEKEEEIRDIIDAHEDILDRMDEDAKTRHRVTIRYKLKSGRTVTRSYHAPADGTNYEIVRKYFYTPQQLMGYTDWDQYVKNMNYISVGSMDIPEDLHKEFLLALKADCEAGAVTTPNELKGEKIYWLQLEFEDQNGSHSYRELVISSDAANVLALMKQTKYLLGFEGDLKNSSCRFFSVDGEDAYNLDWKGLLEALQKDAANGSVFLDDGGVVEHFVEYNITVDGRQIYRYLAVDKYAENTISWIKENLE